MFEKLTLCMYRLLFDLPVLTSIPHLASLRTNRWRHKSSAIDWIRHHVPGTTNQSRSTIHLDTITERVIIIHTQAIHTISRSYTRPTREEEGTRKHGGHFETDDIDQEFPRNDDHFSDTSPGRQARTSFTSKRYIRPRRSSCVCSQSSQVHSVNTYRQEWWIIIKDHVRRLVIRLRSSYPITS